MLNAISRALQLDDVEREHLFDLARTVPPTPVAHSGGRTKPSIRASVQRVLNNMNLPAVVCNAQQDLVASNLMGRALFTALPSPRCRTWPGSSSSIRGPRISMSTGRLCAA